MTKMNAIPLITGIYTPKMRSELELAFPKVENFTSKMIRFYCTDENFERLDRAKELGEKKGGYAAIEVALAWLLHKPFPVVPIVGPHNRKELASCIKATSIALTEWEIKWLGLEVSRCH